MVNSPDLRVLWIPTGSTKLSQPIKVAGKPVNTRISGIMSDIKRNEFSEYRIPDHKQSYR